MGFYRVEGAIVASRRCQVTQTTRHLSTSRYILGMKTFNTLNELAACVGQEVAVSDWLTVTQAQVNTFADATSGFMWTPKKPSLALLVAPSRMVF
jgi:hypothetical protein